MGIKHQLYVFTSFDFKGNQIQFNFSKLFKTEKVHFNCIDPQRIEIWETFEEVLKTLFKIF